jgi:hypothetical protein
VHNVLANAFSPLKSGYGRETLSPPIFPLYLSELEIFHDRIYIEIRNLVAGGER